MILQVGHFPHGSLGNQTKDILLEDHRTRWVVPRYTRDPPSRPWEMVYHGALIEMGNWGWKNPTYTS